MAETFLSPSEIRRVVSGHMPTLDGLRGVAILLVLIFHLAWMPIALNGLPGKALKLTAAGWTGVELFFVLSGFLITGILIDSKSAENYLSSFYLRRALRILPLYYGSVIVAFLLLPVLARLGVPHLTREFNPEQFWYWFYAANWAWHFHQNYEPFGHFWSLAVEEQFYFVWPWIVLLTSRRTLAKICVAFVIFAPLLRVYLFVRGTPTDFIYSSTWSYLDVLALGALAALVVRDERWTGLVIPHIRKVFWAGFLGFVLLSTLDPDFEAWRLQFVLGLLPISIAFAALLLWAVATSRTGSPLQRALNIGWLRAFGKYSYAIYIFHPLIINPLNAFFAAQVYGKFHNSRFRGWFHQQGLLCLTVLGILFALDLIVDGLIMLGLGKLSWLLFEGPINGLKNRFKVRRRESHSPVRLSAWYGNRID